MYFFNFNIIRSPILRDFKILDKNNYIYLDSKYQHHLKWILFLFIYLLQFILLLVQLALNSKYKITVFCINNFMWYCCLLLI
jgi:hypothetical protein